MIDLSVATSSEPRVLMRRFAVRGVVLRGTGELDLLAAPLFEQGISSAIDEGHQHLVVDLEAATFMDCACLAAILMAARPLRADRDATLVFAGASGSVERLFELLNFDRTCSVVSNARAATTLALHCTGATADGWRSM
jgi:anti-anti-sigma factor